MTNEPVNEPIEVIVHFTTNTINLLRFKLNERAFKITETVYKWSIREGQDKVYHFRVRCGTRDIYELSFNSNTMKWILVSIQLDG